MNFLGTHDRFLPWLWLAKPLSGSGDQFIPKVPMGGQMMYKG